MQDNLKTIFSQCYELANKINIVLANGQYPSGKYLHALLERANCVICCDGAVNLLVEHNLEPDYIIGDCDSLRPELRQRYKAKIHYLPNQNTNDLTKAMHFAVYEQYLDNIIIMGATGMREDHNLANIALLVDYAKFMPNIIMLSDDGFFSVSMSESQIVTLPGQQVSLFAVHSDTQVTTQGLKWDLAGLTLDSWHKGTLNQAISTSFYLNSTSPLLVYRSFTIKS